MLHDGEEGGPHRGSWLKVLPKAYVERFPVHAITKLDADQCPVIGASGIKCSIKKKSQDERCSFRMLSATIQQLSLTGYLDFVPVCNVTGCKNKAFDNTPHCEARTFLVPTHQPISY